MSFVLNGANRLVGLLVMLYLSYRFSLYLYQLHDNEMWFSEITELEREISLRTEQGLYYSYYKHLVKAPSLAEGKRQLEAENTTESGNTINIFHRFNIHQELALASLYKLFGWRLQPIFFYVYFVFSLQGLYLSALFFISWSLTGTWLAGVLTAVYAVVNRFDVTRVNFTVSLREHFSLPFIFSQFYFVGSYLKPEVPTSSPLHLSAIFLCGLVFTLCWQFAQFVLLLQALVLLGLATLGLLDKRKVCRVLGLSLGVMLSVWYLQHYQAMVLNSMVVSLVPVAILSLQSQGETVKTGFLKHLCLSVARVLGVAILALCLNMALKVYMDQTSDNHIFRFLVNKVSRDSTDFETQLYLCNEAFKWLDGKTFLRLATSTALPLCGLYTLACLCLLLLHLSRWSAGLEEGLPDTQAATSQESPTKKKLPPQAKSTHLGTISSLFARRQDLTYHIGQSLPLGVLAASTLRMKCFWTPYICVLASSALADPLLWMLVITKLSGSSSKRMMNFTRHLVLTFLIVFLASQQKPIIDKEMSDLREFYDPDTVDLMQWIQQNTDQDAVFSGSMQLLAGVRLCTGRTLTNHPHFEDKALRERTKELYQMYAKSSPSVVHSLLRKYSTSYIILEDSICLAHRERCSLPDIMDLTNGHVPDDGVKMPETLVHSKYPRFCVEVRYDSPEYRKLFSKVFENKTFRVYKVQDDK